MFVALGHDITLHTIDICALGADEATAIQAGTARFAVVGRTGNVKAFDIGAGVGDLFVENIMDWLKLERVPILDRGVITLRIADAIADVLAERGGV